MRHLLNFATVMLMGIALVFTSCDKEDALAPVNNDIITGTITIDASAYDKWVYFSFADKKEVTVTDHLTSTAWDIAFHRQDIRINCGNSGVGKGGTYNAGKVDFSSVTLAPETGYEVNTSIKILESKVMPPVYVTVPGDVLLAKWIEIVHGATGPQYNYSNNIYVIKTTDGKYAKIWLKDYFNNSSKSGYVTMKYNYQPDGSRKVE